MHSQIVNDKIIAMIENGRSQCPVCPPEAFVAWIEAGNKGPEAIWTDLNQAAAAGDDAAVSRYLTELYFLHENAAFEFNIHQANVKAAADAMVEVNQEPTVREPTAAELLAPFKNIITTVQNYKDEEEPKDAKEDSDSRLKEKVKPVEEKAKKRKSNTVLMRDRVHGVVKSFKSPAPGLFTGLNDTAARDLTSRGYGETRTEYAASKVSSHITDSVSCEVPDLVTDQRLKNYFRDRYKYIVMYVPGIGWHQWDKKRWCNDVPGGLYPLIDRMQRELLYATENIANEAERMVRRKALILLESHLRQSTVIQACQHVPDLIINANRLDMDTMLLNCLNGTIDLTTGVLKQHDPADLITRIINIEYDPSAACPTFMKFIAWAMQDDMELVSYLQRFVGYCLTGKTTEQILNFWYGSGGNGKSTLMNVFQWLLCDYATTADTSLIMKRNNGNDGNRLAMLAGLSGSRFVTLTEINDGEKLDEAAIKSYTGGDTITCRKLYESFFTFVPQAKLVGFGNYRPHVRGTDHGIWRRIHLVPFNATISEESKDPSLPDKLRAELPGILAWAVRGCLEWQRVGLQPPAAICDAIKQYRETEDVFQSWLNECCTLDESKRTSAAELISSFKDFSGWKMVSDKKFGEMLRGRDFQKMRSNGVFWQGISLGME